MSTIGPAGGSAGQVYQPLSTQAASTGAGGGNAGGGEGADRPSSAAASHAAGGPGGALLSSGTMGHLVTLQGVKIISLTSVFLQPADRQFISAATGVDLSEGVAPSGPNAGAAQALGLQVAASRMSRQISGPLTSEDFNGIVRTLASVGQTIDPQIVNAGLKYLESQAGAGSSSTGSAAES